MIIIKKAIAFLLFLSFFLTACSTGKPVIIDGTNLIITKVESKQEFKEKLSEDELKFIDINSFTQTSFNDKEVNTVTLKKNYSVINDFKFKYLLRKNTGSYFTQKILYYRIALQ